MRLFLLTLSPDARLLTATDDLAGHGIVSSRDAAGNILINGGSTKVAGGKPAIVDVGEIDIFGLDGNDNISVDETNGLMSSVHLFGGNGKARRS